MDNCRTRLTDLSTGKDMGRLETPDGHVAMVTSADWSADDSVVFTTDFSSERNVVAWAVY